MPTKRTWRERQGVEFLSAYQAHELLTGQIFYPVLGYDGYGDYGGFSGYTKPDDMQEQEPSQEKLEKECETLYEETLQFVQDFPEDAAWLLQNYMEENGFSLHDLINGIDTIELNKQEKEEAPTVEERRNKYFNSRDG